MTKNTQPRVCAIHDISCFGRCSLTVALPVISAAGVEASVIPTALLSTHTGGFTNYIKRDLMQDMLPTARHWQTEGIIFDVLYTGYLASVRQIDVVLDIIGVLKPKLVLVDPVMGDGGRFYGGFDENFAKEMRRLCAAAHVITPNETEAGFLGETKAKATVVTGVTRGGEIGAEYTVADGTAGFFGAAYTPGRNYHGTGDVFASVLCAALALDKSLSSGVCAGVRFMEQVIQETERTHRDVRDGVVFEPVLHRLRGVIDEC